MTGFIGKQQELDWWQQYLSEQQQQQQQQQASLLRTSAHYGSNSDLHELSMICVVFLD
jgi:hypothetical protein